MKTLRARRTRSKTRKMKGGLFEFLSGIFGGPSKQEPLKAKMYALNDPNGPIVPGAGFTSTSFSLAPGVDYSYTTNAYGHKQAGLSGTIPAAVGLASLAQRVANPPAEGIFGLKGEASEFSKYPNPYFDLAVTEKSTNAEIKAAYNTKMRSANNSQKKNINAAYATLSDPVKRAKFNTDAKAFYATHKPTPGNLVAIYSKGTPEQQKMVKTWQQLGF